MIASGELSSETLESWLACDMKNRGITRLEAVESYLTLADDFGEVEEKLLIEWLETSLKQLAFSYNGLLNPDRICLEKDGDNRLVGFSWSMKEDLGRNCDEDYGVFTTQLFGWSFEHFGVSYFNEDMWYNECWGGESDELSSALSRHLGGCLPHVEDYIDDIKWRVDDVERAFDEYVRDHDCDGVLLYRDDMNRVYVFDAAYDEEARIEWGEPTPLIPDKKVPEGLVRISETEAAKLAIEQGLPFEYEI